MRLRKIIMGITAIGMPLVVMSTVVGVGAAWAGINGTGSVSCTKITGTVKFNPPIKGFTKNSNSETQSFTLTATGCKTSTGSNIKTVTKGTVSKSIKTTDTSCIGLAGGSTSSYAFPVNWTSSPAANASTVDFIGFKIVTQSGTKDEGFSLPKTAGQASVAGSFAGSDKGKTSVAVAYSNETSTQLANACKTGVSSLTIASGTFTLK